MLFLTKKCMEQTIPHLPLIGSKVPDITLNAFHENQIKEISLSSYKGKWLILFFYPADFTFVCPTELQELAQMYTEFTKMDTEILSVSTDTAFVHKAWWDNSPAIKEITFPMLADPSATLCKALNTYIPSEGLSLRATFIIDPEGSIKAYEMHDNSIGRSAKELMRKLQAAQFVMKNGGEVCPAGWEPGKETLTPNVDLVGKI